MIPYLILFFITLLLAFSNNKNKKIKFLPFFVYCVALGIFVGLGDMLGGYDRYIYAQAFESQADAFNAGFGIINNSFIYLFGHEPIYGLLNYTIGIFTSNRYIFIFIVTIIMYVLFSISLYRNSTNPFFALLIFMGLMFFFSFTYLRQMLAAGVLWFAIPYVIKRKLWLFLLFVLIASCIHNSAIYFIILYFIPRKKFRPTNIILFMILMLILGISGISKFAFSIYGNSIESAAEKASIYINTAEFGFRIEYLIESILFLFILLKNYSNIKWTQNNYVLVNTYLMFCAILLFFIKSSDGGRMAWYCLIGIIAIVPQICALQNTTSLRVFITILLFTLYLRILFAWGIFLYPYKTFLTNGIREGDYIEENYEYDHNYDDNKFYK